MTEQQEKSKGYRVLRTTVVLAEHSASIQDITDNQLRRVLDRVTAVNYDFGQLTDGQLELLYAYFDDGFMARVKAEFVFHPSQGSIRDNGSCVAICMLCGKGDSRDDGENRDHIRYEFYLQNEVGGKDVWCGETCIINHALKVDGAGTSAEARKLLEQSLRQHKKFWKEERWRAENADHPDIPEHYQAFRFLPNRMSTARVYYFGELQLAGYDVLGIAARAAEVFKPLKAAARWYQRHDYLPPVKHEAWTEAKKLKVDIEAALQLIQEASNIRDPQERYDFFVDKNPEHQKGENDGKIRKAS